MSLWEAYRANAINGGAYRRASWPVNTYWRLNSAPRVRNNNTWQGNKIFIPEQRYTPYTFAPTSPDGAATDWEWIDQQSMENLTISQKLRATKNEDTIV